MNSLYALENWYLSLLPSLASAFGRFGLLSTIPMRPATKSIQPGVTKSRSYKALVELPLQLAKLKEHVQKRLLIMDMIPLNT